ncbi:MAG: ribonuclease HII [Candidatus Diapherotrites archaeon]|nr:ribonuclease HII [Candidatus Diapherotrites archaeon]
MLIAGIDEAGRGPCVGPMVMAVAVIEKERESLLSEIGVADSKLLSPAERESQFPKIKKSLSEFATVHILPEEIDSLRDHKSLNEIEAMRAAELLNCLKNKPQLVYVDSPDVLQENFGLRIKKYLSFDVAIKSEHKADVNYPIVSAASILAKVERDAAIKVLEKTFGKIGSGYPHDPDTIAFIEKYLLEHNKLPSIARKSWDTSQRMLNARFQTKLFNGEN